jgi:hypothetical protein
MARIGGTDKIIVRQFQFFGERLPVRREYVAIFLWIFFLGERGLLDFLAVFIEAGQKKSFLSQAAVCARNHIGHNLLVSMTEMRLAVDVINRSGDEKPFTHRTDSVMDKCSNGNSVARNLMVGTSSLTGNKEQRLVSSLAHQIKRSHLQQRNFALQFPSAVAEHQP